MKTITTFNFLTSSSAAPTVVKMKGYLVCLLMLLSALPAFSQNGTYTLSIPGATTSFTSNQSAQTPFMAGRQNYKVQYLYMPAEFAQSPNLYVPELDGDNNVISRVIKTIAFNVGSMPQNGPHVITDVTVKIGHYPSALGSSFANDHFGNDWTPANYPGMIEVPLGDIMIDELGWKELSLGSGFVWDGVSAVIVEICKNSPDYTHIPSTNAGKYGYGVQASTYSGSKLARGAYTQNVNSNRSFGISGCSFIGGGTGANVSGTTNSKLFTNAEKNTRPIMRVQFACESMTGIAAGDAVKVQIPNGGGCKDFMLDVVNDTEAYGLSYQWEISNDNLNWSPISGATSAKFAVTQTTTVKYYRRAVQCGAGSAFISEPVSVIAPDLNTFAGGVWSKGTPGPNSADILVVNGGTPVISSDARACGCEITSGGQITVMSGVTLQIDGRIDAGPGGLFFQDNASLIQTDPTAVNTGSIVYQRKTSPIAQFDYVYWSSPVQNQTLISVSPATLHDKFWRFNESAQAWGLEAHTNIMAPGRGYIIRAPQGHVGGQPQNATFIGKPNNGNITTPISLGTGRFNLIGNPYPSAISIEEVYNANSDKIDGTFYYWTHHTPITGMQYSATDYAVANMMGVVLTSPSSVDPNGHIAAGQSVMVKAKDGTSVGPSTLLFTNAMRRGGNVNDVFFRAAAPNPGSLDASVQKNRVWLDLQNAQGFKQLMVGYVPNATMGYDDAYDGRQLAGTVLSFYSVAGSEQLAIQARPAPFDVNDEVPLGFSTTLAGTQTITMSRFDGAFVNENIAVLLEDTVLGVTHNLRTGSYSFVSAAGSFPNRFILKYGMSDIGTSLNTHAPTMATVQDIIAFKNSNNLHVASANAGIASVKVFDLSGRLLASQTAEKDGNEIVFDNPQWSSQVLVLQAVMADHSIMTKKIVF